MTERDRDEDMRAATDDPAGEHGGDTGQGRQKGKGRQAEKGDWRRDDPVHSGPTRNVSEDRKRRGETHRGQASSDLSEE